MLDEGEDFFSLDQNVDDGEEEEDDDLDEMTFGQAYTAGKFSLCLGWGSGSTTGGRQFRLGLEPNTPRFAPRAGEGTIRKRSPYFFPSFVRSPLLATRSSPNNG
jgi:hypothetical protein